MTSQFDFSVEQWEHIATTPVLVGFAVAKAEDSGFLGSIRETRTLVSSIAAGVDDNPAAALINQAAATETDEQANAYRAIGGPALAEAALTACRELAALLDSRAEPTESTGYKNWILDIARTVAEAAKEDGVRISPAEADLIDRIESALSV